MRLTPPLWEQKKWKTNANRKPVQSVICESSWFSFICRVRSVTRLSLVFFGLFNLAYHTFSIWCFFICSHSTCFICPDYYFPFFYIPKSCLTLVPTRYLFSSNSVTQCSLFLLSMHSYILPPLPPPPSLENALLKRGAL